MSTYVMTGIFVWCLCNPIDALAIDAPQLGIQNRGTLSGKLRDGDIITQGRITAQAPHIGFQVWSDVLKFGHAPNQYVVMGIQSGQHKLRIRIEGVNSRPDNLGGKGMVIDTSDDIAPFNIVSDGEQIVVADNYLFEVKASVMSPPGGKKEVESAVQLVSLDFNAEPILKHELHAALPLFSNDLVDNTVLARGVMSTEELSPNKMAVRLSLEDSGQNSNLRGLVLRGENNTHHQLKIKLQVPDSVVEDNGWVVTARAESLFQYQILADGSQKVPADAYIIKVEGTFWRD